MQRLFDLKAGKLGLLALSATAGVFAGGTAMPWSTGLTALSGNLTGDTALAIATIGAVGTVGTMMWQGEVNTFVQRGSYIALGGGTLLAIPKLISVFGIGGALL